MLAGKSIIELNADQTYLSPPIYLSSLLQTSYTKNFELLAFTYIWLDLRLLRLQQKHMFCI